jgi:hypothetical protein
MKMVEIDFQLDVQGQTGANGLFEPQEIDELLDSTRSQIRQHILQRLSTLEYDEHNQPVKVLVIGTYDADTEQIEFTYNIDACCNLMTMRAAALLSRV